MESWECTCLDASCLFRVAEYTAEASSRTLAGDTLISSESPADKVTPPHTKNLLPFSVPEWNVSTSAHRCTFVDFHCGNISAHRLVRPPSSNPRVGSAFVFNPPSPAPPHPSAGVREQTCA